MLSYYPLLLSYLILLICLSFYDEYFFQVFDFHPIHESFSDIIPLMILLDFNHNDTGDNQNEELGEKKDETSNDIGNFQRGLHDTFEVTKTCAYDQIFDSFKVYIYIIQ